VVAADDGVKPQTEEAVQHAKAAGVPLIVAMNKIDKEGIDLDRVRNELSVHDVISEDWGGDTQFIPLSAHTGQGVDELLDSILLQSEMLELKAPAEGPSKGVVLESRLDKGRGVVTSFLVQEGLLKVGDTVLAGEHIGRVRAMHDELGRSIESAGPSMPVEVLGLSSVPDAGESFMIVPDEKKAREVAEFRKTRSRETRFARARAAKLENIFENLKAEETATVYLIIKADVRGSMEAIIGSLTELSTSEVAVSVVSSGVGGITETDANLALTSNATIIGFNTRADGAARQICEAEGIDIRYYSVIYDIIDDVKKAMSGLLEPERREEILGVAEVRDVFRSSKFGTAAGCMVVEGTIHRNKPIRVLRDDVVIFKGELESLRRFKDDAAEVRQGMECGVAVKSYNDVKPGDKIEVFDVKIISRSI
ncbi:MAG TPA: translation initiation factor IF-2, partial [Gammaproteobacteria bacterium]|nr:translation initiation factor IF-2 [Gammaproteobacteria bacterium]